MNQSPTPEDIRRETEFWQTRQMGDPPTNKAFEHVKGSLAAWFAMRLWYDGGESIFVAAEEFGVSNDEIMESLKQNRPIAYHLFMARLTLALSLAGVMMTFHSWLTKIRDTIDRAVS